MKKSIQKKQAFDYAVIAAAYHEAGHAVCGLHNYLYVYDTFIITNKIKEANTLFYDYGANNLKDQELKKILLIFELQMFYAGLVAEKMYYKDICGSSHFPMHLRKGSWYDIASASNIIRKNGLAKPGKSSFLLKKQIKYDVENIISEHWDDIKVIAHSLYQKKRLSFDELKFILTKKTNRNEFWKERFKKITIIHKDKNSPTEDVVKDLILDDAIFSI